jgi:hypothetical protein
MHSIMSGTNSYLRSASVAENWLTDSLLSVPVDFRPSLAVCHPIEGTKVRDMV